MNRTEATKHKGNVVLIDRGEDGIYYGELLDIVTPPKKTWSGKVKLKGIVELPTLEKANILLNKESSAPITVPGSKIYSWAHNQQQDKTFRHSVLEAVNSKLDVLFKESSGYRKDAKEWEVIGREFGDVHNPFEQQSEGGSKEEEYVYYQLREENGKAFLHEPIEGDVLELDGCPFDFEISKPGKSWTAVIHRGKFLFEDSNGKKIKLREYEWVRIHKKQFQPFHILLNELEDPSQKSLLHGIHSLGFTLDQLSYCHNRLLHELLQSEGTAAFKGVNFITFQNDTKTLMIQHHYERELKQHAQDYVFDRFEFTTDAGKRSISTYTNIYSKGHES